jgi:carotenoid cleavage dioxygenase-like enzyme
MKNKYPNNRFLQGPLEPIRFEADAPDLFIEGDIPEGLKGTYYRNGPNPLYPPRDEYHPFSGDGMVHEFKFDSGRVSYRNRWVKTDKWKLDKEAGEALFGVHGNPITSHPSTKGIRFNPANTNIIKHGGRLLALYEDNPPFELDAVTLEPIGPCDFDGQLEGPMTAHPKFDPKSGEMLFFGYGVNGHGTNDMSYTVISVDGKVTRSDTFKAPYASMVHDFIVTDEWVVFPIFPAVMSPERASKGGPFIAWDDSLKSHIGILRRDEPIENLRWIETDPCYVYHPANAYESDGILIADMVKYDAVPGFPRPDGSRLDPSTALARLERWSLDLSDPDAKLNIENIYDNPCEFPRIDERFAGQEHQHIFMISSVGERAKDLIFDELIHISMLTKTASRWSLDPGDVIGEPVFVPRDANAIEGEGYILTVVYSQETGCSYLAVFSADKVEAGPIAKIHVDHRVPAGFHGNWVAS